MTRSPAARRIERLEAAVRRRDEHRARTLLAAVPAHASAADALKAIGLDVVGELARIADDWRTPDALKARILTVLAAYGWPRLTAVEVADTREHRFVIEVPAEAWRS